MMRLEDFSGIYLYRHFVDMRRAINGLSVMVEQEMGLNPFSKQLFIFMNRRRNLMKMLYWRDSGFAMWYTRLEKERFPWPKNIDGDVVSMEEDQLRWLLKGYDIWRIKGHGKLQYDRVS